MRIARLALENFRVFPEVDLELPAGVVGIYGPNGSGKSTLVEAVLWALFGLARTGKEGVRRDGAEGDCRVVVGFEHEGHDYEISRSLSGAALTVRAEVCCDGIRLASGATAVRQYVHHVLGMSADAFRASVFCEQKQVDAFSARRPEERRRLVLDLLGITPIDRAREAARGKARSLLDRVETGRVLLGDLDTLAAEAAALEQETAQAAEIRAAAEARLGAAEAAAAVAEEEATAAELRKVERDRLAAAWNDARRQAEEIRGRLAELGEEHSGLDRAAVRLTELEGALPRLDTARTRWVGLEALAAAEARLARVRSNSSAAGDDPAGPLSGLEQEAAEATRAGGEASGRSQGLEASHAAALERREAAAAEVARLRALDREAPCPLCGQSLDSGDGNGCFAEVVARTEEALNAAQSALATVAEARAAARHEAAQAAQRAADAQRRLGDARAAAERTAALRAAEHEASERVAEALEALGGPPAPGEIDRLRAEVADLESARDEAVGLSDRLRRADAVAKRLAAEGDALRRSEERAAAIKAEGQALAFDSSAHAAALAARTAHRAAIEAARAETLEARLAERGLSERLSERRARLASELDRRRELADLEDDARHHGRLAELLTEFRNSLVGEVGPALSAQTTILFRELTDGRFDRLDVDGDSFELRVSTSGAEHSLERHSGSESDLANLSLRVAIAEQVSLLSGGQVGLLVLDEVLGSLDGQHRDRLIDAIGRLSTRFRQILLVTHSSEWKERLPSAVEVVPITPGHSQARMSTPGRHLVGTGRP